MGRIALLEPDVINQIAAGEVIERPASVVKELVENAIDAGASQITVEISAAGLKEIRVIDNGYGMTAEEARLAIERHATSKIRKITDLNLISTLGFRGEALPSIASVSHFSLVTRTSESTAGVRLVIEGGESQDCSPAGCPVGTQVTVRELFYNTQPRLKFLKSSRTESGAISDLVSRFALGYPEIAFRLYSGKKQTIVTGGQGDLHTVFAQVYSKEVAQELIEVAWEEEGVRLHGLVTRPGCWRASRYNQTFFVNRRLVKNTQLAHSLENAYWGYLTRGQYPLGVLFLEMDPESLDVNAHPTKSDVRFNNTQLVLRVVHRGVRTSLEQLQLQGVITPSGTNNGATSGEQYQAAQGNLQFQESGDATYLQVDPVTGEIGAGCNADQKFEPLSGKTDATGYSRPNRSGKPTTTESVSRGGWWPTIEGTPVSGSGTAPGSGSNHDAAPLARPPFSSMTLVGQVQHVYIIAEYGKDVYLIDQHAAHERVKYEETREKVMQRSLLRQQVAAGVTITLTPEEAGLYEDNRTEVERFGLVMNETGENSYQLQMVPVELSDDPGQFLKELLDLLRETRDNNRNIYSFYSRAAYSFACKHAIKAGDRLSADEMQQLLVQLDHCEQPDNCPHGRPTWSRLTGSELAGRFYRT